MRFRPLGDRVVRSPREGRTEDRRRHHHSRTAQEKPQEGEIIASVPARWTTPANAYRRKSRRATSCCSANGPAPK